MKKVFSMFALLFAAFLLVMPAATPALAQSNPIEEGLNKVKTNFPTSGKLTGSQDLSQFINNVINILLSFAIAIDVFFIIIGGYQYITSAGNEERATKGKKTLINAIIGLVIIILSYVIVTVVNRTLSRG